MSLATHLRLNAKDVQRTNFEEKNPGQVLCVTSRRALFFESFYRTLF